MTQTIRLLHGDCLVRLSEMGANSLLSAVFDPPYHISFMGKTWDSEGDGTGIAFSVELWQQVFRVLEPGGIVKVFGGTRTFHRMAEAMEAAGFTEIHLDAWSYGCLPIDSEILTESGWKPGISVNVGEKVACWDPVTGKIALDAVQETFRGPFSGNLISFKNDNTDQALTPNHRVYKRHRVRKMVGGVRQNSEETDWNAAEAGSIDRWNNIRLPLAGFHEGPGIGGVDFARFLGWVWSEGGFDRVGAGVRLYQSSVNQSHVDEIQALLDQFVPTHSHYTREREHQSRNPKRGLYTLTEHCWYFSGEMAERLRGLLPDKHPTWELVWKMSQEEKLAFMRAAIRGDGQIKQGKLLVGGGRGAENYTFTQYDEADLVLFQGLCHLTGRQGRVNLNKWAVCVHNNPTTQLQARHLKASQLVPYTGDVWCVRVPTGAFLARRNGLVFITGNSGFPKSLNVSKALDKMSGAERGTKKVPYSGNAVLRSGGQNTRPWMEEALKTGYHELADDTPVTNNAKTWEGWGTALKPSFEPIIIGRKPL